MKDRKAELKGIAKIQKLLDEAIIVNKRSSETINKIKKLLNKRKMELEKKK